jgi:endonuclease/exonuclease/phosphatase family metal-dependent hydrolase
MRLWSSSRRSHGVANLSIAICWVLSGSACVVKEPAGEAESSATINAGADPSRSGPGCAAQPPARGAARVAPPLDDASIAFEPGRAALWVMTWNLEWFQDPDEGPTDDAAQYAAVRNILASSSKTLVALEEVASEDAFDHLMHDLPRYAGALSGYAWTQKTALLWDSARFELVRLRAISGLDDAGRPPLEARLRDKQDQRELVVIVLHAKAQADAASYDKRASMARGLKAHLDAAPVATPTIVVGDFNDLLLGSITDGADTPYRPFLDDPAYAAPTRVLNQPEASETSFASGATVDHVIVSHELAARIDPKSVDVMRSELLARYPRYTSTISDHFPVTLAIAW